MKKVLFAILLGLCIEPAFAQSKGSKDNISSYGKVGWSERRLRWDDFRAQKPIASKLKSGISFKAYPRNNKKVIDGINYKYADFVNYVVQDESWVDNYDMSESRLKLCQIHFDLWESLLRDVAIQWPKVGNLDFLYAEMQRSFDQKSKTIDEAADYGRNASLVDSISKEMAKDLTTKELDPREISKGLEPSIVKWQVDAAVVSTCPFSEYLSMTYGFSGGLSFNRYKRLYGFDIDLTFGKSNRQIVDRKGIIENGDALLHGGMTLYFGYNAYDRNKLSLTPFIGAGVRFFDGGDKYEEYRKGKVDTEIELAGFSAGLGMIIDFKLKHTINSQFIRSYFFSKNNSYAIRNSVTATETHLRVKPYFSITNYGNDLGWVPALNICVGINGKSYIMKKYERGAVE